MAIKAARLFFAEEEELSWAWAFRSFIDRDITIYNESDVKIQVFGRKWLVIEGNGECVVVEGSGVIGETPTLNPGESFSYNSYHVVASTGEAAGALYGVADGERFMVEIPEFALNCP